MNTREYQSANMHAQIRSTSDGGSGGGGGGGAADLSLPSYLGMPRGAGEGYGPFRDGVVGRGLLSLTGRVFREKILGLGYPCFAGQIVCLLRRLEHYHKLGVIRSLREGNSQQIAPVSIPFVPEEEDRGSIVDSESRRVAEAFFNMGRGGLGAEDAFVYNLFAYLGREWRVGCFLDFENFEAKVCSFSLDAEEAGGEDSWILQDSPAGAPAITVVRRGNALPRPGGVAACFEDCYISREVHYSCGRTWDPKADLAAEISYRSNGSILCLVRHQGGVRDGRKMPCAQGFWKNGLVKIVEYGRDGIGKHRDRTEGPAYLEFFPSGSKALEIYCENGLQCRAPGRTWTQRKFDAEGNVLDEADFSGQRESLSALSGQDLGGDGFWRRHPESLTFFPEERRG